MKSAKQLKKVLIFLIIITVGTAMSFTLTGCSGGATVNVEMERA
jgi:hypothetical protein